jgi:hypothetical protein
LICLLFEEVMFLFLGGSVVVLFGFSFEIGVNFGFYCRYKNWVALTFCSFGVYVFNSFGESFISGSRSLKTLQVA